MLGGLLPWGKNKKFEGSCSRKQTRFPIHAAVSLALENGAVVVGLIKDMGVGGLFIKTSERPFGLTAGEEGDLGLVSQDSTPDGESRFPCKVVRIDRDGIAIQFFVVADGESGSYLY
jgi:hypothetical protein